MLNIEAMRFIYLSLLLLISCLDAFSANYYVSEKLGDRKFSGRSPSRPKSSIQDAADLTKPGDTVFVMNGRYSNICSNCDVVSISRSGTSRKPIVYINYPGHHPVIRFNGWAGFSIRHGASYIRIEGFEVIGNNANVTLAKALRQPKSCANPGGDYDPRYNGNGINIDGRDGKHPHHIVIARNTVHHCGGGGIGASQADYVRIEDNLIYNNGWYTVFGTSGIALYQFWNFDRAAGYHNIVRRNKCYNNRSYVPWINLCKITDGNGIIIDDFRNLQNGSRLGPYTGRTLIENNICWYNGGTGMHTFQSDHVDMINNTAYCNSQSKELNVGQIIAGVSDDIRIINNILVSDAFKPINSDYLNTHIVYQNNLHYNTTLKSQTRAAVSTPSCITGADPLFVKPANSLSANFQLRANSPAIDRGDPGNCSGTDFNRRKRPQGKLPEIGAYEYYADR